MEKLLVAVREMKAARELYGQASLEFERAYFEVAAALAEIDAAARPHFVLEVQDVTQKTSSIF